MLRTEPETQAPNEHVISIHEDYRAYTPPRWVRRTIEGLLASVQQSHLSGLGSVVLTNSGTHKSQKGPRRTRRYVTVGRYHAPRQSDPAWIELIVDQIIVNMRFPLNTLQAQRDLVFGRVLFHELGHHLHRSHRGVGRTGEQGADAWRDRLLRIHIHRKYGYLRPLASVFRIIAAALRRYT